MADKPKKAKVREPVQVYLDRSDKELLDQVAQNTGLPRAEVLRRGLRRFAERVLTERRPGWSLDGLIGSLGHVNDLPADLAERHDDYLYRGNKGDAIGAG